MCRVRMRDRVASGAPGSLVGNVGSVPTKEPAVAPEPSFTVSTPDHGLRVRSLFIRAMIAAVNGIPCRHREFSRRVAEAAS